MAAKHETMELEIYAQGTKVVEDYLNKTIEEICSDPKPRNTEIVQPNSNATNSHISEPGTIFFIVIIINTTIRRIYKTQHECLF